MIPDRAIVRKIKNYDPHLFVEWNNRKGYFEVWRSMPWGRRLITPVTNSIYSAKGKLEFCPLDERILWWLYEADGQRTDRSKNWLLEQDKRWMEFNKLQDKSQREEWRAKGREMYSTAANFFATKHAPKNSGRPNLNKPRPYARWINPDVQARTSNRLFSRSSANAKAYGFKK